MKLHLRCLDSLLEAPSEIQLDTLRALLRKGWVGSNGQVVRLSDGGTVLGIFPDASYEERQITLEIGDRLVLLTDGITEADNAGGEEFGEDRLTHLLVENRRLPGTELKRVLLDAVSSFASHALQDDATLMIISMV